MPLSELRLYFVHCVCDSAAFALFAPLFLCYLLSTLSSSYPCCCCAGAGFSFAVSNFGGWSTLFERWRLPLELWGEGYHTIFHFSYDLAYFKDWLRFRKSQSYLEPRERAWWLQNANAKCFFSVCVEQNLKPEANMLFVSTFHDIFKEILFREGLNSPRTLHSLVIGYGQL